MISATRIQVKKLHEDAIIPKRAHKPDAGFDMTCISVNDTDKFIEYGTGIAMHIPEGYVGLIFPRSSVTKKDLLLKNSVGVIDSGYLGEIRFRFWKINHSHQIFKIDVDSVPDNISVADFIENYHSMGVEMKDVPLMNRVYEQYEIGDRIGQIIFFKLPDVLLVETNEFDETERGTGGYGSTDKVVIPEVNIDNLKKLNEGT